MSSSYGQAVCELLQEVFAISNTTTRYGRLVYLLETDLLSIQADDPGAEPGFIVRQALNGHAPAGLREQIADAIGVLLTVQLRPGSERMSPKAVYNILVIARQLGSDPTLLDGTLGSVLAAVGSELSGSASFFASAYRDINLDDLLRRVIAECIR